MQCPIKCKVKTSLENVLQMLTPGGCCALQILGEPKENRKLAAEITLQNPLPEPLDSCCFSIEGANLTGGHVISERLYESLLVQLETIILYSLRAPTDQSEIGNCNNLNILLCRQKCVQT